MNVVPAQVAGVGSIALASPPQKEHGGLPAPHDPGGVRAARRRRGVRRRRRAGDRDVRLRRRAVPAGRPGHRAGQHLHGRGQAAAQGAGRHRLRGRPDRDRDPGRRHRRRGVRRRRPGQPGRARPAGRRRAGHRLASGWPTTSRPSSTSRSHATRHTERIRTALAGPQSGIVLVDDLEQGLDVVNAYAAEHLEIQTARRRRGGRPGAQRRRDLRRPASPRCRSATTAPAPTTCCPPAAAPATPRGCRCARSSRSVHVVDYSREALAEVADHVVTLAEAEDLPGHGAAVRVRFGRAAMTPTDLAPAAGGAARHRAVRRPAARRPGPAQRQREPLPALAGVRRRHRDRGGRGGRDPEPLPRPRVRRAARGAGGVPRPAPAARHHAPTRCGRPTAPTR